MVRFMMFPLFDYETILHCGYNIHGTGNENYRLQFAQNSFITFIVFVIFNIRFEHISPGIDKLIIFHFIFL